MTESVLHTVAGITVLGGLCQWLAWRMRLPAILLLLIAGVVAGPLTGWLDPDAFLGDLLFPFVSLAVAVVVFEGALTLRASEIVGLERVVRRFVTSGVLITWAVAGCAAAWLTDMSWGLATLFGAIMVVTGPTVIVPMLRTVRPTARIANILRWEGIVIDPIGALLAVLVYEFIVVRGQGFPLLHTFAVFIELIGVGAALGLATGFAVGEALRRDLWPRYLFSTAVLAAVFGTFVLANTLAEESGLLAVTIMGLYLGNRRGVPVDDILAFKENLSLLLITTLFILLAARVEIADLRALGWAAGGIFLAIQFIARPLKVMFCTWGSPITVRERLMLAWIAPRGIVAAAVSSFFAIRLSDAGYEEAWQLMPLTFVVIAGTVVLQSLTARPLARALGVAEPGSGGVLILGAHALARAIGEALQRAEVTVMLADTQWDDIRRARMAGLPTYYGNALSSHAELFLDTTGIGHLLALTPDEHLNELACTRYSGFFQRKRVFRLRVDETDSRHATTGVGRPAFGEHVTLTNLVERLARGGTIRHTTFTKTFGYAEFLAMHGERAVPLFVIDHKKHLTVVADDGDEAPAAGSTLIALVDKGEEPDPTPDIEAEAPPS